MEQQPDNLYELEKLTHAGVSRLDPARTLVLATLSPIEVHGPHLPLGQDWFEAAAIGREALRRAALERGDWSFLMVPPIPISIDCVPHLGSINYPVTLIRDVAFYTLRPFARRGFGRLCFSSFHGSPRHICALEDAAERLHQRYGVPAVSIFSLMVARIVENNIFREAVKDMEGMEIEDHKFDIDSHAGLIETSLALHLWPELVEDGWRELPPRTRVPDVEDGESGAYLFGNDENKSLAQKLEDAKQRLSGIFKAVSHYKKYTYNGYPALASAEMGERMFDHTAELGKRIVLEFLDKGADMERHSPLWKMRHLFQNRAVNYLFDEVLKPYSE